jgi:hypothetical protein
MDFYTAKLRDSNGGVGTGCGHKHPTLSSACRCVQSRAVKSGRVATDYVVWTVSPVTGFLGVPVQGG